ncbi:MAG: maleate cis-trans isomerase [Ilumatobacteraceae bacterium]
MTPPTGGSTTPGDTRRRIGLIVPSSNVTMEIEVPKMLHAAAGDGFSFHSSRMRMRKVSAEELAGMNEQAARCVDEVADARCDIIAYACLVAVMVQGPGAHREVQARLEALLEARGDHVPVVSSAGALVDVLNDLGARRIAMVTPYVPALTDSVVTYLAAEGIETSSVRSLSVADNYEVGCIPGDRVVDAVAELDITGIDALVLSACVQMPSLDIIDVVQQRLGLPVVTAASATSAAILRALGASTTGIPGGIGGQLIAAQHIDT